MLSSTRRGIQFPNPDRSDRPDIPRHIKYLIDALEVDAVYIENTDANRLATTHMAGVFWWTTDTQLMWFDDGTAWHLISGSQSGTSFPVSPTNDQEFVYVADATTPIYWRFKYNASMSMWIFVGGDELFSEVTTAEATNSATYANLTTVGPSVTVPRAGDYLIEVGSEIALSAGAQTAWVSFDIAGAGAVDADGFRASGTSSLVAQGSRMRKKTSVAVFSTVIAKYKSDGTNNATYGRRWMRVKPIRVS
jgi:hypothetical protein